MNLNHLTLQVTFVNQITFEFEASKTFFFFFTINKSSDHFDCIVNIVNKSSVKSHDQILYNMTFVWELHKRKHVP